MRERFTETESRTLAPFFTNLDKPVFGLKLPEEVAGALFSRYSRSTKGLRRTFLEEFVGDPELALAGLLGAPASGDQSEALRKARAFYDRVLVGYGDDSVAQLGGAHIACEAISNVAAKLIEDARIGIAPLEKSTRYVRFDQKDAEGRFAYHREARIMESPHARAYERVLDRLFETYSRQIAPMIEFVSKSLPIDAIELRHPRTGEPLSYADACRDAKLKQWAETAFRSTVRAHACDVLRGYLPAATLTNVGLSGVGQAYEYLVSKLLSNELAEARALGEAMHAELEQLIPSFVKRARRSPYLEDTRSAERALAETLPPPAAIAGAAVTLVDWDRDAEERILAALLYPHALHPLAELRRIVSELAPARRAEMLEEVLGKRRHRRDKPGRAFEQAYYTFDFVGNLGLYRDLHRHRILSQERQDFTTAYGYDVPPELEEAGFRADFDACMNQAAELHEAIRRDLPREAQYAVPFAYRVRWYMKLNLREAVHIAELRTMPQGHPDYRRIVQEMWQRIADVHPALARSARFIDWKTYRLGRLQSEIRTEYKKSLHEDDS